MVNPLIIDLSHHNEVTDFDAIKKNGTIGIIHKATEGWSLVDETYKEREQAAKFAGLEWASYHYLHHGNVEDQMANYLQTINPQKGNRVIIDYEEPGVTLDDLREAVAILFDHEPKLEVSVYSGHLIKEHLGDGHDELLAQTSLWIAQYTSDAMNVTWPMGTWNVVTLWQYTDSAPCAGVAAACDGNKFNGTEESAHKWFQKGKDKDDDDQEAAVVTIDINVPDGVMVHITVNGDEL